MADARGGVVLPADAAYAGALPLTRACADLEVHSLLPSGGGDGV